MSAQDHKLVMTTLKSNYSDPFSNAKILLDHHKKAGTIPELDIQLKEAARTIREHLEVIQQTKMYQTNTNRKDDEKYIYTESYV